MRATLVLSPNWRAAGGRRSGRFMEAWAGWLGEPGLGDDWLKMAGSIINIGTRRGRRVRATASPYTGWAGFNYDTGLPREQVKEVLLALRGTTTSARSAIAAHNLDLSTLPKSIARFRSTGGAGCSAISASVAASDIERIARMGLVITTQTNQLYLQGGAACAAAAAGAAAGDRADAQLSMPACKVGTGDRQHAGVAVLSGLADDRRGRIALPSAHRRRSRRSTRARRCAARRRTAPI